MFKIKPPRTKKFQSVKLVNKDDVPYVASGRMKDWKPESIRIPMRLCHNKKTGQPFLMGIWRGFNVFIFDNDPTTSLTQGDKVLVFKRKPTSYHYGYEALPENHEEEMIKTLQQLPDEAFE